MKPHTSFWNQRLTFNVWLCDWTKKVVIEANIATQKEAFIIAAKKHLGSDNIMWELSGSTTPEIVIS